MPSHISLEEVARYAGVSTATASRVLNNRSVRSINRLRVLKAAEELGYQPNLYARDLAGGKSRTIGMIVSNMENPFFFDIFRTVETQARSRSFEVLAANTDYRPEQLVRNVRLMIGRRVAGVAVITSEMDPVVAEELGASQIPAVLFDNFGAVKKSTNIRVNYRGGMTKVIEYLYSLGHRRLGFLGHHAALPAIEERAATVLDAAAHYALDVHIATAADTLEGGRQAAAALLNSGFAPTALICVNDIVAFGALRELRERRIPVPQRMSVVGFDNVKLSEFSYPTLTTVHIPRDRIGQIICDSLVPGENHTPTQLEAMIETDVVVRDSSGPAAQ